MALLVKKFGGSSVATPEKIMAIAKRILAEKQPEDRVVIVVSAMGDTTDDLLEMAQKITDEVYFREMDMLLSTGEQMTIALMAMAFRDLGHASVSFTGGQAGIMTNNVHTKARIKAIEPERVIAALEKDKIVIVAGFQGITDKGDVSTLGRGGSDTTAVALAGALKADACEIYTDVDGVYTADPRIVKKALRLKEITYNEMLEMARLGAVVMQPRAVEMGNHYQVPIHVRSTFTAEEGTFIREECLIVEEREYVIRGVAHDTNVVKMVIVGVPDKPGVAYKIFSSLAKENIDVDMILQCNRDPETGLQDILFTISRPDSYQAKQVLERVNQEIAFQEVIVEENMAKVSVVGASMQGRPGIAATMFGAMADANVNVEAISTSEICISCLIHAKRVKEAVNAIHERFFNNSEFDKTIE